MSKPRAILWTAVSTQAQADDEKTSLPAQEADLRVLADKQGWQVIDVLTVPGHSRRYIDWHELVKDSLKAGIDSFAQLQTHLDRRDFDVLAVRDADRFARTQTLHAYIVESVIEAGAIIWSLSDGKVDEQNFRMFIAMSGYKAAGAIDQLQKYRDNALNAKAEKGLPISPAPLWGYRFVRSEHGKVVDYELDESKRRAFNDLAELILSGAGWRTLADEMNSLGHRTSNGGKFDRMFFYFRVLHPTWWGHAARGFHDPEKGQLAGDWVFDADAPVPDGVRIWRDRYPAVWTGEKAERIKAELRRRGSIMRGNASSAETRRFSGIVVCGKCGRFMQSTGNLRWRGMDCRYRYNGFGCTQNRLISEKSIIEFLTPFLKTIKATGDPEMVLSGEDENANLLRLESARAELATLHNQARALTRLYAEKAGTPLERVYAEELAKLESRAAEIEHVIARSQAAVTKDPPRRAVLESLDVDTLWEQPSRVVNQTLHAVLGQWRLVADGGKIVGYTRPERKTRNHPR